MVNGKSYQACIEELQAMRPKKEDKGDTGYEYIEFHHFQIAMDKVFGNEHYSISYSEPIYHQVLSGQETITVKAIIEIIDDDRKVIKHVEGFGDKIIDYTKSTGRADLTNLTSNAAKSAFKDACKYFGIFGYQVDNKSGKEKNAVKEQSYTSKKAQELLEAPAKEKKPKVLMMFKTETDFFEGGENKGSIIWKIGVFEKDSKEKAEIIFYPNNYKSCSEWFNKLYAEITEKKSAVTLKIEVRPCGERDGKKQYVFLKNAA